MTTGKTIALARWTFVGKVMSLLFNMLSRWVIAFLPRSKHLLISCLQSPSAMILESPKIKSLTISIVSPCICHEVMRPDGMILVFWMLTSRKLKGLRNQNLFLNPHERRGHQGKPLPPSLTDGKWWGWFPRAETQEEKRPVGTRAWAGKPEPQLILRI